MAMAARHHHLRSLRLHGYNYASPGAYFVTLCAHGRACVFGEVVNGAVLPNGPAEMVRVGWLAIADHFPNAQPDMFVIMPNHVHGIIYLTVPLQTVERFGRPVAGSIPTIIRSFKSATARHINNTRGTPGASVWQRGYYERVIRDCAELDRIRQYIAGNPSRWASDTEVRPALP
jgi:putative transposase